MNFKSLFAFLFFCFSCVTLLSQQDTNRLSTSKLFIVSGAQLAVLTGSYFYVKNSWWADNQNSFHFDEGADLKYALNVDKAGHFMGGIIASDLFSTSMNWAGMDNRKSLFYGALYGTTVQLAIEVKDAYAPYWGFSKWDLLLGTSGSFWPVIQHHNENFNAIDFKFSYFKKTDIYWQLDKQRGKETNNYSWHDDYPNQTYWITFNINHFITTCCWPDWLNVAIGFGIDDTQYLNENNAKVGGKNEFYLALDYDIPKILKKWDNPTARKVKSWLNYFHFPAPTIRISPNVDLYPLFL